MKADCAKAAKALGMDIVGFDVLATTKKDYAIIEANSGSWLHDIVCDYVATKIRG